MEDFKRHQRHGIWSWIHGPDVYTQTVAFVFAPALQEGRPGGIYFSYLAIAAYDAAYYPAEVAREAREAREADQAAYDAADVSVERGCWLESEGDRISILGNADRCVWCAD